MILNCAELIILKEMELSIHRQNMVRIEEAVVWDGWKKKAK